jgi:hypothetical protein
MCKQAADCFAYFFSIIIVVSTEKRLAIKDERQNAGQDRSLCDTLGSADPIKKLEFAVFKMNMQKSP